MLDGTTTPTPLVTVTEPVKMVIVYGKFPVKLEFEEEESMMAGFSVAELAINP